MRCPFCGKENPDGANFCDGCGKNLEQINLSGNKDDKNRTSEQLRPEGIESEGGRSQKKKKRILSIIIPIAAVAIVVFCCLFIFGDNNEVADEDADYIQAIENYSNVEDDISEEAAETSDIFSQLPDTFGFSSGAGAWSTELYLNDDGTFTGYYHDSDMGVTGDGYRGGTVYICEFSGKFTDPVQVDEYTYSMELEYLNVETEGDPYIENEVLYVPSEPYGLDNADEFLIYMPGAVLSELPEDFLNWSFISTEIRTTIPSGVYGIYNVSGQEGFVGKTDDCFWDNDYRYEYEETYSEIRPSYYSDSHIVFFPDSSSASSIDLHFAWSEDDQSIFYAEDTRGSGDYEIEIILNDDKTAAQVTITSQDGADLSAYGGTKDGTLTCEYILV